MKTLRAILICSEILFVLLLLFPPYESRSLAGAIAAYHREQSPENQRELDYQKARYRHTRIIESVVILVLLMSNSAGLVFVFRKVRLHEKAVA